MEFFDFNSEKEFNLDEEYSKLNESKNVEEPVTKQERKKKDAENIISEIAAKYVEGLSLDNYEKLYSSIESFLKRYRTDSDEINNMSESERTKLFGYGITMFKNYENLYQTMEFNFELSRDEWNFLDNVLTKKMKYSGKELFNYWQLKIDFLDKVDYQFSELPKGVDSLVITTKINNLILTSHLLMEHEEMPGKMGNTGENRPSFIHFKNILFEMAQITKLFNAYGVMTERLNNKFNQWVNALNEIDGFNTDAERIEKLETEKKDEKLENE